MKKPESEILAASKRSEDGRNPKQDGNPISLVARARLLWYSGSGIISSFVIGHSDFEREP